MGVFSLIISEITQTYRQKDSVSIKIKQSGTLQNCSVERLNSWITVAANNMLSHEFIKT